MKPLFILLAQSATGAIITIVALLLVAAIIGYLTAWFYAKSVYTPVIKSLEEEKAALIKQVEGLKDDVSKLESTVANLNEKIAKLEEDLTTRGKDLAAREKELAAMKKELQSLKKPE
jgi:septal ring factor EnvC (AmiA/AmiB activator)